MEKRKSTLTEEQIEENRRIYHQRILRDFRSIETWLCCCNPKYTDPKDMDLILRAMEICRRITMRSGLAATSRSAVAHLNDFFKAGS